MFNPSELEGEVDHSFFDSDCDDGVENTEKGLNAEKESPPAPERLHAKQTEKTKGGLSPKTDETKKHLKLVDNSGSRAERQENSCQSKKEESSRASSVSSVACTSDKAIHISSDGEADSDLQSKRHNGTFMALLDVAREVDCEDVDSQRPNEYEEDALPSKNSGSKGRNEQSPEEQITNWRTRSPSPTSTESSVDADSESSSSSRSGRSSVYSPTLPRPNKPCLSPGVRRTCAGSAASLDVPVGHTDESEDTVTDVSPLSSPDISPLQSLDLNHAEAEEGSPKERQQLESVPSSGLSDMHQDEDSDQDVDECSLRSESQLGGKLVFCCTGPRNRKNYSFTDDEVRRIDRENQRLLRELSRQSPVPRPGSSARKKTHMASKLPQIRFSHSALNRQREQQRIERENLPKITNLPQMALQSVHMRHPLSRDPHIRTGKTPPKKAFLKRLESVKPTPGLKCSEQLKDYQRNARIVGPPSYPVCMSTTMSERSTSKTPSGSVCWGKSAMFDPSELEGEVDHSFFDSDCDDSSRDGVENTEKGLRAEKESPPAPERLHAKQTEETKGGLSPRTDETKEHLKLVDNSGSRAERQENSCQSKTEESSRASSESSVACTSDKAIHNSSDGEADSDLQSKRHNGTFMASLDVAREVDCEDVDSQRPNEYEEDALPSNNSGSKGRNEQSPEEQITNCRTRSPSPTSTESSVDADSESTFGSRSGRSSVYSPTRPTPNEPGLSPGVRRTHADSAASLDVPVGHTDESEDTVTDVRQQLESVPSSGLSDMHQDEDSDQDVDECHSPVPRPGSTARKKTHMANKLPQIQLSHRAVNRQREQQRIEKANLAFFKRLEFVKQTPVLKRSEQLKDYERNIRFFGAALYPVCMSTTKSERSTSKTPSGPRPGSTARKKTHMTSKLPQIRFSHSTVNWQRAQQRIEKENLVFLERLESVKPTPGLNRSETLKDYQRNTRIMGAALYPVCMSTTKSERSTSKTPSAGPRPASSTHYSSRAVYTTNFSKTPLPRTKKQPSAAWC